MGVFSKLRGLPENRAEVMRKDGLVAVQENLDKAGIRGRAGGLLRANRDVSEFKITDRRWDEMSDAIRTHVGKLAALRVRELRQTRVDKPLPSIHKAQKVTFNDGRMQIHMGSRAGAGLNVVALPKFSQPEGHVVEQGRGVQIYEFQSEHSGAVTFSAPPNAIVQRGREIGVDLVFSEQNEDLRESRVASR